MKPRQSFIILILSLFAIQEPGHYSSAQESPSLVTEVIAEKLHNPCGIAIHPNSKSVFVSESGQGRVLRFQNGKSSVAITGFPTEFYGKNPAYKIGPLGLLIIENHLIVGEGGLPAGKDRLLSFELGDKIMTVDDAISSATLSYSEDIPNTHLYEGNFHGIVEKEGQVFVTSHGNDSKGWLAVASFSDQKLRRFHPFTATSKTKVHAPTAIALSRDGNILVGQFGETNVRGDSAIIEVDLEGNLLASYHTGLNDITSLAYDMSRKKLYALDFSWMDQNESGLYELTGFDKGAAKCQTVRICSLSHPTAMAIDSNGQIWITEAGSRSSNESANGRLLKLTFKDRQQK